MPSYSGVLRPPPPETRSDRVPTAYCPAPRPPCQRRREDASAGRSKLHQDGMPKAPTGGLLVSDKQDEKRNCLTRECYRGVGHSLTNQLPLPHCSRSSQAPLFPYSM